MLILENESKLFLSHRYAKEFFSPWLVWLSALGTGCEPKGRRFFPSQGTCLGCGPGPQLGARESQPHIDVSLPLFLPPFPSL